MKKLKVMMMTLMMCLVSMSVWGQDERTNIPNVDESCIISIIEMPSKIDTTILHHQPKIEVIIKDYKLDVLVGGVSKSYNLYNIQGVDVTNINYHNLIGGVYIVKVDNNIVKILVK